MPETKLQGEVSQEQIDKWKQTHGDVYRYEVEGHVCYLKNASRQTVSHAEAVSGSDNVTFNETLLNDCWLGGSETVRTNDAYFLGISSFLAELIQVKTGTLKKI